MIARRRPGRIKRFFNRIGEFFGDLVEGCSMTEAEAKLACAHGKGVIYKPHAAAQPEDGVILRCNTEYAFVLYRGDTIAKATRFEDLELAHG